MAPGALPAADRVALHLGLNWDWVLGVLARQHRVRPARAESTPPIHAQFGSKRSLFRRGLAALAAVILSAGLTYWVMDALLTPPKQDSKRGTHSPAQTHGTASPPQLVPGPRPMRLAHGLEKISVTSGLVLTLVLISRYVFRLRL